MSQHTTEAGVAAHIMERYHKPEIVSLEEPLPNKAGQLLVLPSGMHASSVASYLNEYRDKPKRIEGEAQLEDIRSFIEYVRKFADTMSSKLFADSGLGDEGALPNPRLVAVIDHHHASHEPRFGKHRAIYGFPLSNAFKAWLGANEKTLPLDVFANFLEDRMMDVIDPERIQSDAIKGAVARLKLKLANPAELLDLSKGLSLSVDMHVKQKGDIRTGQRHLEICEKHSDETGKPLEVPSAFVIAVQVFRNAPVTDLFLVRLRYRVKDGKVFWSFGLHQHDVVFGNAFREICDKAQEETSLPLYYGKPES